MTPPPHSRRQALSRRQTLTTAAGVGVGLPVLAACSDDETPVAQDPGSDQSPSGDGVLTTASEVPVGGGVILGDVVITQPTEGDFRGFSPICTHQGCKVAEITDTIDCPCHGAKYSLETGEPVSGPANQPLAPREVALDGDDVVLA